MNSTLQVLHRTGQWCPARRIGDVVAYDLPILPQWQIPGHPTVDRAYLLLGQGIQLIKTVTFDGPLKGWWYVDVIELEEVAAGLVVHDLYVDFLVPPGAERYHVLDLDELGDALSQGRITAAQCAAALSNTQAFIERHLRGEEKGSIDPPPQFPPAGVAALEQLPSFFEE